MSIRTRLASLLAATAMAAGIGMARAEPATGFGIGNPAAPAELKGFVSTLPDGRGLPPGSGSVAQGRKLYAGQCAACHGQHLEGGLGDRLVGGRGSLKADATGKAPIRTVESYWPYATTLFDYIKRAMPMDAPGSLSDGEIYSLTAYILAEARIIAGDAVIDAHALARIRMPNRDGFIPDGRPEKFPDR